MRKYDDKTKGIFSLLVRTNFARILWSLLVLVLLLAILAGVFFPLANMPYFTLRMIRGKLLNEQFDRIDNSGITDGKGSFEILDYKFSVIYPEDSVGSYTRDELNDIWPVDYLRARPVMNEYTFDGVRYTQIICNGTDRYDGWFLLVDDMQNYVDSVNFPDIKEKYSDEDLQYYLKMLIYDRGIYKHEFISDNGHAYTMIIKFDEPAVLLDDNEKNIIIYTMCGLGLLFILFIILSINSVSRKFKMPIKQLDTAMVKFSDGNFSDISIDHKGVRELKNIIDTFNEMVRKLEESEAENRLLSEEKQELIADISHDLKTPITIIQGYADALYQGRIPVEEQAGYLEKIQKKTEYLTQLINEFSYYSKIDYPGFELEPRSVDICGFVRDFIAENYNYIADNGYKLVVDIPQESYPCSLDATHFNRCLENLVSNFIKHNPAGTTIHAQVERSDDLYSIILENDGTPVDVLVAARLFEPFVMGDKSRSSGRGSGLGLAVVKKIIELHGGTIVYSSKPDYVNCFTIFLPKLVSIGL